MIEPGFFRYLLSREWSAEQARLAVELLGQDRRAIWAVHGESMAAACSDDQERLDRLLPGKFARTESGIFGGTGQVALHFLWKPTPLSLRRSPLTSKRTLFLPA
jgi:hypothetical protein